MGQLRRAADRKSKKSVLTQIYGVGFWLPDEEGHVLR